MSYLLKIIPERRLSLKIISGKIRQFCPSSLYGFFLFLRYIFFPRKCKNTSLPEVRYSDGSWVSRSTTKDLRTIQTYLLQNPSACSILQIGFGNSSLFETVQDFAEKVVGITVVQDEIDFAYKKFPDSMNKKYFVYLMNKYSNDLKNLDGPFDYIIDNDLSSYACCHHHFAEMMQTYRSILSKDGSVLVGLIGLGYFDSGFGLSEKMAGKIANKFGFSFSKTDYFYKMTPSKK